MRFCEGVKPLEEAVQQQHRGLGLDGAGHGGPRHDCERRKCVKPAPLSRGAARSACTIARTVREDDGDAVEALDHEVPHTLGVAVGRHQPRVAVGIRTVVRRFVKAVQRQDRRAGAVAARAQALLVLPPRHDGGCDTVA